MMPEFSTEIFYVAHFHFACHLRTNKKAKRAGFIFRYRAYAGKYIYLFSLIKNSGHIG